MELFNLAKLILSDPKILFMNRNIFLLSHMRANTSLLSHIIGSHPEIDGYYELHMGYSSWKSLWRQRLVYYTEHKRKPTAKFIFDKILHHDHYTNPAVLERANSKVIFMLREPERSIQSIIHMFHETTPALDAPKYYVNRLHDLEEIAKKLHGQYFYLDASTIIHDTEQTLQTLSQWIGLENQLNSEYEVFKKTGVERCGDTSENIKSGTIKKSAKDKYANIVIDDDALKAASEAYHQCRQTLIEGSALRCITD